MIFFALLDGFIEHYYPQLQSCELAEFGQDPEGRGIHPHRRLA